MAVSPNRPIAVRAAEWVLLFIVIRGTLGVGFLCRDLYRSWSAKQDWARLIAGLSLPQVQWVIQWLLAGVALWALHRRKRWSLWLAVGLVLALAYQPLQEAEVALQVTRGYADPRPVGYRNLTEAGTGVVFNLLLATGLAAVGLRAALSTAAKRYLQEAVDQRPSSAAAQREDEADKVRDG